MTYVLDAAVAVAALRSGEADHVACLRRCMAIFSGRDAIVVPAIFDVELVSALVRRGVAFASVTRFLEQHLASRAIVTVGPRAVRAAQSIVAATRLRAADSLYVWVAARRGLPLVTLDREILGRAALVGVSAVAP